MPKRSIIGILIVVAASLTLACLCLPGFTVDLWGTTPTAASIPAITPTAALHENQFVPTPNDTKSDIPTCTARLEPLLSEAENGDFPGEELENEFRLVTYQVSDDTLSAPEFATVPSNLKSYQSNIIGQQEIWNFFVVVIPADQRTQVSEFVVYTDGVSGLLGAVEQTDDPHTWAFEMDIQDARNFPDLSTTIIHEFAHLLTLNDTQVIIDYDVFYNDEDQQIYDAGDAACDTYFIFQGCSLPDSYINQFYERFWLDIFDEWLNIDAETNEDILDRKLDGFYQKYADQFVSSYAVTNPDEDIAESFMYFVFAAEPVGDTIADQKILFFYEYPVLVALHDQLVRNLCPYVAP